MLCSWIPLSYFYNLQLLNIKLIIIYLFKETSKSSRNLQRRQTLSLPLSSLSESSKAASCSIRARCFAEAPRSAKLMDQIIISQVIPRPSKLSPSS